MSEIVSGLMANGYVRWARFVAAAGLLLIAGLSCGDVDTGSVCHGVGCSAKGVCQDQDGAPVCICISGYRAVGPTCLPKVCTSATCIYGDCRDDSCICNAGYAGDSCDRCAEDFHVENLSCVPDNPCDEVNPCNRLGGVCTVTETGTQCVCYNGYTGATCASCAEGYHEGEAGACLADSPCNPDPCAHGGCQEIGAAYYCDCETGYQGDLCDQCAPGYHDESLRCVADDPTLDGDFDLNGSESAPEIDNGVDTDESGGEEPTDGIDEHPSDGDLDPDFDAVDTDADADAGPDADVSDSSDATDRDDAVPAVCTPNPCREQWRGVCSSSDGKAACSCDAGYEDLSGVCQPICDVDNSLCTAAVHSAKSLVSSNGYGVLIYDVAARKADALYEHVYKKWGIDPWRPDKEALTRDLLYDTFMGIRVNGVGIWLNTIEPTYVGYFEQTGIIHVVQYTGSLRIDAYLYAPYELSRPAAVMLATVTNEGSAPVSFSLYTLHNYRLGPSSFDSVSTQVNPTGANEHIRLDVASGALYEQGPGGAMVYYPLGTPTHHGFSPDNPWTRLTNNQDLTDNTDSGVGTDLAAGFQKNFTLAAGERGSFGAVAAFELDNSDAARAGAIAAVTDAYGGIDASAALESASAAWRAWRIAPPTGLSRSELMIYRQSEAMLRMGQVREPDGGGYTPYGQIVASLPATLSETGYDAQWNITWVRDMSYALAGLARAGHVAEAKAGLQFLLAGVTGRYNDVNAVIGRDYRISVTRYYGNGQEETDANGDGLNIEFDGFGLFLWALSEYVAESGDTAFLAANWAAVRDEVGDVLISLVDSNGLITSDSSIWEVHWNGQQKQFAYTSIAAAAGLCHLSALAAQVSGASAKATQYAAAAKGIRDGIVAHLVDGDNVLASSVQELQSGSGYMDAAGTEAFAWRVLEPAGIVATATFAAYDQHLTVAHGKGYFRNDNGDDYDKKEWVFVDLRMAQSYRNAGRDAKAEALSDWVTAQAAKNYGVISEQHDPSTAVFAGSRPMIGFGAGAYLINLWHRQNPGKNLPQCW